MICRNNSKGAITSIMLVRLIFILFLRLIKYWNFEVNRIPDIVAVNAISPRMNVIPGFIARSKKPVIPKARLKSSFHLFFEKWYLAFPLR